MVTIALLLLELIWRHIDQFSTLKLIRLELETINETTFSCTLNPLTAWDQADKNLVCHELVIADINYADYLDLPWLDLLQKFKPLAA